MRAGVELAGLAGAVLLAVAWARLSGVTLYRGGLLVCALGAVAVIAAAAQPHVGPLARALSFGPFVGLGLISYGVYLWHWPIYIWFDPERVGVDGWALFGIRLAVTIVVAIASFVLVEQPIRRGAFGRRTLRWATPLAAGALVVITLVSTAGYTTPVTHADVGIVDATAAAREARRHPEARRLLVVGNSVGFFLAGEGFSRLVTHPKVVTLNVAKPSCAYPDGVRLRMQDFGRGTPTFRCADGWREARLRFRPEVVLMLFSDSGASRLLHHGRWLAACDPRYGAWYRHALTRTTERFMARGARVVLTTGAYSVVFGSSDAARAETDCKNRLTRDFARSHPGVGFVDLARFVCPTRQECRDTWHGVTLRMDGTHFRGRAARLVARWLYDQLDLGSRSVAPSMPAPLP